MRIRVMLIALICGLLAACSDSVPPPPTTTSLPATPTPVASAASPTSPPEEPTVESATQPTPESTPQPTIENSPPPTLLEVPTPLPTVVSAATPMPVPAGPLTIVAMGDSLTEGEGDQPGDGGGFPARLLRSINEVRPDSRIINLGKSGWTSQQMVEGQLPSALEAKPQLALVWIGSNDMWNNNGPENAASDVAKFKNNIDKSLRALTGQGARVFIALLDDQSLRPYATDPAGASMSPEGVADMSHLVSAFNDTIRATAAEYGATTVDFYNTKIFTTPATQASDGIHPNAKGYDEIARIWLDAIRLALK